MRRALLIAQREVREILHDFNLLGPMIAMPSLVGIVASMVVLGTAGASSSTLSVVLGAAGVDLVPPGWMQFYAALPEEQQGGLLGIAIKGVTLPLFWIITVALTSTISADSFVGEKERGTLEPLLATPIRNGELFVGKLLTAVLPAVLGTWVGIAIFAAAAWFADNPYVPRFLLTDGDWLASILGIVPLTALLAAGVAAVISTRVATVRAAYQLNGLVVLPVMTLLIPQTVILFFLTPWALAILGAAFAVADSALVVAAIRGFDRDQLLRGM